VIQGKEARMATRLLWAGALLPIVLLLAGCLVFDVRRGEPVGRRVLVQSPAEVHGQIIYMRNCYRCHQGGEGGLGPALNWPIADPLIRLQVRHGFGAMPAFARAQISDSDLNAIIAYLKAVRRS
jgi:mono/diheme cytochrome c family protein